MSEYYSPGDLLANVFFPGISPQNLTLITNPWESGNKSFRWDLFQAFYLGGIQPLVLIVRYSYCWVKVVLPCFRQITVRESISRESTTSGAGVEE